MPQSEVITRLLSLRHDHVLPVAEAMQADLAPDSAFTAQPTVLFLGNHSSGKSSFINHLLGRRAQRTGVAPTDDGFTFVTHDDKEAVVDGHSIVTDPKLPFGDLAGFGEGLVLHLQGKRLPVDLLRHVWLIDSPGMIDSGATEAQRPYDFPEVVRWFAQRADLVLLFFDPEKPGTTGETLKILTESLAGVDDKLFIVMNKMDLFEGIRDFARTYGALCWNLSRNLPTKDLPHIYTTVIPELVRSEPSLPLEGFATALLELERQIVDLPERREDKAITRVYDESRAMLMRAKVIGSLHRRVRNAVGATALVGALLCAAAAALAYGALIHEDTVEGIVALGVALALVPGTWLMAKVVGGWTENRWRDRLDLCFEEVHRHELARRDRAEDLHNLWSQQRGPLLRLLDSLGLASFGGVPRRRIRDLERLIERDLPGLRK